jgi:5-methylcytosine-specific restriction endonuclease McrA
MVSVLESCLAASEEAERRAQKPKTPHERSEWTKRFRSGLVWARFRVRILKRDNCRCVACGASPSDGTTVLSVDHYLPLASEEGWQRRLDPTNCFTTCQSCNWGKLAGPPHYEKPQRELAVTDV